MEFRSFTKLEDCKKLWDKFSPKDILWDLWDFNHCFFNPDINRFYFIVGYENNKEIGLLPLQYESDVKCYSFFGGNYPERRRFFIKDKEKIKQFLESSQKDLYLEYIDDSEKEFLDDLDECDTNFSLNIEDYPDLNSYFATFGKKHRKNIKYDLRQLEKLDYKITWNNLTDFSRLVGLNKQRFGKDSNYLQEGFENSMKTLIDTAEKNKILHMLSVKIKNTTEAAEMAILYNNTYYVLDSGSNQNIENIGKLLIAEHIKNAIKLKAKKIDFMSSDSGWKKLWNLEETKQWEWGNFE